MGTIRRVRGDTTCLNLDGVSVRHWSDPSLTGTGLYGSSTGRPFLRSVLRLDLGDPRRGSLKGSIAPTSFQGEVSMFAGRLATDPHNRL